MSFRTIAKVAIISLSTWQAASAQSRKETNTPRHAAVPLHGANMAKGERK
jgi:hypothetical protein